jgi:hypothetical protein
VRLCRAKWNLPFWGARLPFFRKKVRKRKRDFANGDRSDNLSLNPMHSTNLRHMAGWLPKLNVEGSNPFTRFPHSITGD